jgi:hypothetical protein
MEPSMMANLLTLKHEGLEITLEDAMPYVVGIGVFIPAIHLETGLVIDAYHNASYAEIEATIGLTREGRKHAQR